MIDGEYARHQVIFISFTMRRLFLLDAYALIFRAYYALIKMPRMTRDGFNTSAIFGFVNTLEEVLRKEHPSHIAVCFDPSGPTFRSEAFEEYKAERGATPEDIKLSVPIIREILEAYRIPILECDGFEADDVIGTMARRAEKEDFIVYMMTPDKDFGQLVTPRVLQYKPSYRGQDFELRGPEEVCQRYGIESTTQVIDLLALMGDKIDNIPGCPGVGEKTAVRLIRDFGSVDELLLHTDRLKGALRTKVETNAKMIEFSKFLATIRTDVPIDADPDALRLQTPHTERLFEIFRRLEFRSLLDRVSRRLNAENGTGGDAATLPDAASSPADSASSPSVKIPELRIVRLTDEAEISRMQQALLEADACGVALRADGENDMTAPWRATAIVLPDGRAWYADHDAADVWADSLFATADTPSPTQAAILDLLARPDICKVTANAKRDMVIAARSRAAAAAADALPDVDVTTALSNFFDISLAHYLLQPDMRHAVEPLAASYLGWTLPDPPAAKNAAPSPERLCAEALAALLLREPLSEALKKEGDAWRLLHDLEIPLVPVLADMELTGVCLDVAALRGAAAEMATRIDALEREIHDLAGESFNVSSPARVGEILFDRLRLEPKAKKTKTGQYSTSEEVLEKVAAKHPIVGKILEYRQLKKLLNTYLTALPEAINPATGRVHTVYNQAVTATGRLSSSAPNLQNIPVREEVGREIRRAFIPSKGNVFFSADYSQIELRLVADFAGDPTMIEAFRHGDDILATTAARIFHKDDPSQVSADQRRAAKTANFGILYGISAFGLASRLGIPRTEAKELIDNYFATFPDIHKYMSDSVERARENHYAVTHMGRRRWLPDINSKNPVVRGYAERNAINAPVQGSAADIIKRAMIDIWQEMRRLGLRSRMIMQVHDELNFDVVPAELPQLQQLVERLMEGAYNGRVRLTASGGVGTNWLEAH